MLDVTGNGVTVAYPTPSQMPKATQARLEIFWEPDNNWVAVTPTSVPPGSLHSGGPTGMFWWVSGLEPDTQYRIRFNYSCKEGGECPSGDTIFTTDQLSSSSSSSSSSACPCGGPAPIVTKHGPKELGMYLPTSGLVNVTGDPALQILWDGAWVPVTKPPSGPNRPQGEILSDKDGRYWSVSGLASSTTSFFLFVYQCTGGGECKSEIGQGTTTKPSNCDTPACCGEGCC